MKIILDGKEIDAEVIINTITSVPAPDPVLAAILEGWRIAIDKGHGGEDPGAVDGINPDEGDFIDTYEKDLNTAIGEVIIQKLLSLGAEVIDIRQGDNYVGLSERAGIANAAAAHIFFSGHGNSATPAARGIETYNYPNSFYGSLLANAIHSHAAPASGLFDRGVKEANFCVLRETNMPAALTEFGFISNPDEESTLHTSAFIEAVSQAVVDGIVEFCTNYPELKK